jgi:hypothetical protein
VTRAVTHVPSLPRQIRSMLSRRSCRRGLCFTGYTAFAVPARTSIRALAVGPGLPRSVHDLDPGSSFVLPSRYRDNALTQVATARPLRLAALHGAGARRLRVLPTDVTATDPTEYASTARWAEAAHRAGFDGLSYMSKQCNTDRAFVLFGDRVAAADLEADAEQTFAFGDFGDGFDLLVDLCAPMRIDVLTR